MAIDISQAPFEVNIANKIKQEKRDKIGRELVEQIKIDEESRQEWMDTNKQWLRLASQVREEKTFPWTGASNVKFPLLTIAAMQFSSRALPNLVNSNKPVRLRVIGRDPDNTKLQRANRVSSYMSYQLLEGMPDWLDDMDRMLFVLPIVGICYKKTYYSEAYERIRSTLVLPNDLIVNYHAQTFERARMTQVLYMDENEIYELQADGIFLDVDLHENDELQGDMNRNARDDIDLFNMPAGSDMTPYMIYESHCWLDLDEDGYKEPYVVTVTDKGDILRIAARWSEDNVQYTIDGKVKRIKPDEYFTPYVFMPDPSSSVSGLGLGTLLGPINESVNTIINQLIDAGTLNTLQGGFLGRGAKLRGGQSRFRPGEWKIVNSTGDDLRKNIFPMPIGAPDSTLFALLGQLINYGERVSSVSDMMVGENPGQNQPASTTMAVLEQGHKVFTSIQKRIHRSLTKEYKLQYGLYHKHLDENMYNLVLDETVDEDPNAFFGREDFADQNMDIRPASDPMMVSQSQKSVKAMALMELLAAGLPINVQEVTKRIVESQDQEDPEELLNMPPPQPNPEIQMAQAELQHKIQMEQGELQLEAQKVRAQAIKDETGARLNEAKIAEMGVKANISVRDQEFTEILEAAKLENEAKKNEQPQQTNQ